MVDFKRILNFDLPSGQSAFLWGPRKTGKSTFLKTNFPESIYFDFLKTDLYFELSKNPSLFREQVLANPSLKLKKPIIVDEVQKIPRLLDEIHWLIENKKLSFILCGSSARKVKRGQANLLGGRAWRMQMFPLTWKEIAPIDLLKALNRGLIPSHYLDKNYLRTLKAYLIDYLKEEISQEGLVRNVPAFSRFLDSLGYSHGELTNYVNIARDCGVDAKTVKAYYQILVDTLLGQFIEPFSKIKGRQIITSTPKFYLFDVGVAGFLTKRRLIEERGEEFGKAFEHFILMELLAHRAYSELDYSIRFWRTKGGIEVDFILQNGEVAIEVKGSSNILNKHLRPLKVFTEEHNPKKAILVCNEKYIRKVGPIDILPWPEFLAMLWSGDLIG